MPYRWPLGLDGVERERQFPDRERLRARGFEALLAIARERRVPGGTADDDRLHVGIEVAKRAQHLDAADAAANRHIEQDEIEGPPVLLRGAIARDRGFARGGRFDFV